MIYNSGRFRMAGHGSLAGLMPFGDANAIVLEMANEVLPVVKKTPLLPAIIRCLALAFASGTVALAAGPGAERLDRALALLPTCDWGQPAKDIVAVDEAVAAASADAAARADLECRLVAILNANAPVAARQFVCRKLALIGTREAVPALAALLTNEELSHMARFALERIPDAAAGAALRAALPKTSGKVKIGIIHSLGVRADAAATGDLRKSLRDPDAAIAGAAVSALGRIGTSEAAQALAEITATAPKELQPLVSEALLAAAENLARQSNRAAAARIFRQCYTQENAGTLRLAGFRGLVTAEPERATELLRTGLAGNDEALRNLAARLIADPPGDQALKPLLEALLALPPAGQVALLETIRSRRDPSARTAVLAACDSPDSAVRVAALRTLSTVGNASDMPRLARLAAADKSEESAAARLALANLPGRDTSGVILAAVADASPSVRVELIGALTARAATEAAPAMVACLNDPDPAVRRAAFAAVAALGDEAQVPAVIAALKADAGADAEKTLEALVRRTGTKCLEALLAGLKVAKPAAQVVLLEQLGSLGGSRGLAAVRAVLAGDDGQLREGAFQVLAAWPDGEAAPDLLKLMQDSSQPKWRTPAFRGYVRLCRESQMSGPDRLARLSEAARLATDTSEKLLVASALADVPEPDALKLLAGYLDDPALAEAAGVAAAKVAAALGPKSKDQTFPVLQRVLQVCLKPETHKQAREALRKCGVPAE